MPLDSHDVNGQLTTFAYDALCRPQRADRPGGDFTENLYTNIGTPSGQWIETWTPPGM